MKNTAINSKTYATALTYIGNASVIDVYVWNKWLCLRLDSGVTFRIKNNI